jgi:hypothetical protein
MSRVFDRFTDNRLDSAVIDWIVLAAGIVVLTVSVLAGMATPGADRMSGDVARFGQQTEVTPS